METFLYTNTCIQTSIKLFTVTKTGKQANCPSAEEWISECGLTYDGALFDDKKEVSVNTCYNMNEP